MGSNKMHNESCIIQVSSVLIRNTIPAEIPWAQKTAQSKCNGQLNSNLPILHPLFNLIYYSLILTWYS